MRFQIPSLNFVWDFDFTKIEIPEICKHFWRWSLGKQRRRRHFQEGMSSDNAFPVYYLISMWCPLSQDASLEHLEHCEDMNLLAHGETLLLQHFGQHVPGGKMLPLWVFSSKHWHRTPNVQDFPMRLGTFTEQWCSSASRPRYHAHSEGRDTGVNNDTEDDSNVTQNAAPLSAARPDHRRLLQMRFISFFLSSEVWCHTRCAKTRKVWAALNEHELLCFYSCWFLLWRDVKKTHLPFDESDISFTTTWKLRCEERRMNTHLKLYRTRLDAELPQYHFFGWGIPHWWTAVRCSELCSEICPEIRPDSRGQTSWTPAPVRQACEESHKDSHFQEKISNEGADPWRKKKNNVGFTARMGFSCQK